ncbi:uncharacterized protein CLBA1 [Bos javanicus]|uniref:uncharacterized protein CLBA1 n=1 Tax=Bos javanicus TaxID=9906 RepID=UPI002AA87F11|nr:uncharacterized protein CLBA1 [Bos javanicus]
MAQAGPALPWGRLVTTLRIRALHGTLGFGLGITQLDTPVAAGPQSEGQQRAACLGGLLGRKVTAPTQAGPAPPPKRLGRHRGLSLELPRPARRRRADAGSGTGARRCRATGRRRPRDTRHSCCAGWRRRLGSRATVDSHQAICTPEEAVGSCWAVGEQLVVSCEDVFRSAFQEVPVPQATEGISTLDHFLEARNEESSGLESVQKLCSESRKLWRALHNTGTMTISRCIWSESRSRENFLPVLGVDAAQKSLSGSPGRTLGEPGLHEPEELGFHLQRCRALIQTKLSGTPTGGQGSLITYSLFLKTPTHGHGRHITTPREKTILGPRDLKLTLFNSDIY